MLVIVNGTGSHPAGKTNRESGTFHQESDTIRLYSEDSNSRGRMADSLEWGETEREAN